MSEEKETQLKKHEAERFESVSAICTIVLCPVMTLNQHCIQKIISSKSLSIHVTLHMIILKPAGSTSTIKIMYFNPASKGQRCTLD